MKLILGNDEMEVEGFERLREGLRIADFHNLSIVERLLEDALGERAIIDVVVDD